MALMLFSYSLSILSLPWTFALMVPWLVLFSSVWSFLRRRFSCAWWEVAHGLENVLPGK